MTGGRRRVIRRRTVAAAEAAAAAAKAARPAEAAAAAAPPKPLLVPPSVPELELEPDEDAVLGRRQRLVTTTCCPALSRLTICVRLSPRRPTITCVGVVLPFWSR